MIMEATMAHRQKPQRRSQPALPPQLAAVNLHAAGIDVGAEAHDVAVPPSDAPQPVRRFGAYTVDLAAWADGCAACRSTTVALESTGGSWSPLFELWECRGFEVLLVDPPPVQQIKGRPTSAGPDGQWRPRLQTVGLLAGAFRPPDQVCVLRSYLRQRAMFLSYASQPSQHRQKALTQMHLQLQHVVRDVTGETGMAIRRAMLTGERDPGQWARLRNYRCHHDEETIAKALHGQWRGEQLLALGQAVARYDRSHEKLAACDRPSAAHLETCAECQDREALPPVSRPRKRPHVDGRGSRHRITGVDVTAIEGIDEPTALTIISETGPAMGRWPTVQHFTSWLGRCPHHRVSGGKVFSRGTQPSANRVATALRLAASCLQRSQSALGAFCRRMKARLGTPKAITATAHKLARLIYTMLKPGTAYVRQRLADYAQHDRDRMVQRWTRRAQALGYVWVQTPERTPA
jgi:transposase